MYSPEYAPPLTATMMYCLPSAMYVIVAVSGGNYSGEYLAFSVPGAGTRPTNQRGAR